MAGTEVQDMPRTPEREQSDLAAQIVEVLQKSPELMVEVLKSAVKGSSDVRALLGITGVKKVANKPTTAAARHFVMVYGDVSHAPGFVPVPPDHIVNRGPEAVARWVEAWSRGKHIPRDEAFDSVDPMAVVPSLISAGE